MASRSRAEVLFKRTDFWTGQAKTSISSHKVELAANWRLLPPVMMDVGPVLHIDDVVAGKMSALFTRAEPRDFLDARWSPRSCVHTPGPGRPPRRHAH